MVFQNRTLDEIVMYKPTTLEGLEKIKGIGPKRLNDFGAAILSLTRQYVNGTAIVLDFEAEVAAPQGIVKKEEEDDDILEVYDRSDMNIPNVL